MANYNESICRYCFHSYVCEQFNEHKDDNNKKCHFFNNHFVSAADVVEVVRCKDCVNRVEFDINKFHCELTGYYCGEMGYCSDAVRAPKERGGEK